MIVTSEPQHLRTDICGYLLVCLFCMQLRTRKENESTDLLGQIRMVMKRALVITGVIDIWYPSFLWRAKHVKGWDGGWA